MVEQGTDLKRANALEQEKEIRRRLSAVFSQVTAHFATEGLAAVSVEDLIAEALFNLDSTQVDVNTQIATASEAEAQELQYLMDTENAPGMFGLKQRLEQMNEWMAGRPATAEDAGEPGLIEAARAWEAQLDDLVEEDVVTSSKDGKTPLYAELL